jgi:hypothetical protein
MREHTAGMTRLYEALLRRTSRQSEVATCG